MKFPFGDQFGETSESGPEVIAVALLPSASIIQISSCPSATRQNTSREPSGDHFGSQSSVPLVICVSLLPFRSTIQISPWPSVTRVKAMRLRSGDQLGNVSSVEPDRMLRMPPPAESRKRRSPSWPPSLENTMPVPGRPAGTTALGGKVGNGLDVGRSDGNTGTGFSPEANTPRPNTVSRRNATPGITTFIGTRRRPAGLGAAVGAAGAATAAADPVVAVALHPGTAVVRGAAEAGAVGAGAVGAGPDRAVLPGGPHKGAAPRLGAAALTGSGGDGKGRGAGPSGAGSALTADVATAGSAAWTGRSASTGCERSAGPSASRSGSTPSEGVAAVGAAAAGPAVESIGDAGASVAVGAASATAFVGLAP